MKLVYSMYAAAGKEGKTRNWIKEKKQKQKKRERRGAGLWNEILVFLSLFQTMSTSSFKFLLSSSSSSSAKKIS